jgi:hypothetical protein
VTLDTYNLFTLVKLVSVSVDGFRIFLPALAALQKSYKLQVKITYRKKLVEARELP